MSPLVGWQALPVDKALTSKELLPVVHGEAARPIVGAKHPLKYLRYL